MDEKIIKLAEENKIKLEKQFKSVLNYIGFIRKFEDLYKEGSEKKNIADYLNNYLENEKNATVAPLIYSHNLLINCYSVIKRELEGHKNYEKSLDKSDRGYHENLRDVNHDIRKCTRRLNLLQNSCEALCEFYPDKYNSLEKFVSSGFTIPSGAATHREPYLDESRAVYSNLLSRFLSFRGRVDFDKYTKEENLEIATKYINEKLKIFENAGINILPIAMVHLNKKYEQSKDNKPKRKKEMELLNKSVEKIAEAYETVTSTSVEEVSYIQNQMLLTEEDFTPIEEETINTEYEGTLSHSKPSIEEYGRSLGYTEDEIQSLYPEIEQMRDEEQGQAQ